MNENKKILDIIKRKHLFKRYLNLTFALFIAAIGFNLFLNPFHLVAGGTGGVATILDYLYHIEPSTSILIMSCLLTLLSVFFLDLEYSISMIYIAFLYPYFVKITSSITNLIVLDTNDMLIISIFGGVISGITGGIIYKNGLSSGGFNVISKILYNRHNVSITKSNFFINAIIVLLGAYFLGIQMVLYAIIYLYISAIIADRIMLGISKKKSIYIITNKHLEIKHTLLDNLNCGVTLLNSIYNNNNNSKKTLMTVIPTREYESLKRMINNIDKEALVVAVDSYEVKGGH